MDQESELGKLAELSSQGGMRPGRLSGLGACTCAILLLLISVGCARTAIGLGSTQSPSVPAPSGTIVSEIDSGLEQYFQGYAGTFVLFNLNQNMYIRYNLTRAAERFLPASTFKIMNSLIGLETGVIPDDSYVIKWDGTRYDLPAWNQDHTLETAIRDSAVWYFQELARRVGKERMQQYVAAANYGNQDISGQIDTFWLEGGLRISADEQVELLRRLYKSELPFSQRPIDIVKDILVLEKTESYRLTGKTGSVQRVTPHVGWFIGYLETKSNVLFFALNIESQGLDGDGNKAREIAQNVLRDLGWLP
jgi:beta-lactamase class D